MRFGTLLVSTFAATAVFTSAPAQQLPQLDVVLPGSLGGQLEHSRVRVCRPEWHLISAAAGDTNLVFVTEPLNQQIAVLDRFTGTEVGQVLPL